MLQNLARASKLNETQNTSLMTRRLSVQLEHSARAQAVQGLREHSGRKTQAVSGCRVVQAVLTHGTSFGASSARRRASLGPTPPPQKPTFRPILPLPFLLTFSQGTHLRKTLLGESILGGFLGSP